MHPQEWCEVQLRGDARQELAIYDRAEANVLASTTMAGEQNDGEVPERAEESPAEAVGVRQGSAQGRRSGVTSMPTSFVPGDIMTRNEVALLLRCSLPHVVTLIERDGLPAFRLGKLWRFKRSDVLAWCERKTNAKSER